MTTNRPMQPPERQPLGFWTVRAGEAIRARIRGALAEIGLTQPEWWLLHQISLHPEGADRAETIEKIGHNDTPEAIVEAIDSARSKGWIVESNSRVSYTPEGEEQFRRTADVQRMLQEERMNGISEADFVTTIEVLQRTIKNVGGDAWHW
ncbi:MAG: MarR family winged helix-turn-helix transcriptional regulator [Rhodococcus sp. (in: high G+C Gram-positive bacteria)]|uniref:MarR family winged helix-turn-helix transcriptional regulator n=1 Tax=Rhodococcus sp. TaxID=1831 RepID=UPI002AD65AC8|nr:MarR family winged helix-turn-helix transcriptional regulator [Rhodococcus sp. (in: high G+C Gram-positive bacteria)]MDZ7931089.1 MarR family winged helix-turn-helix transcriptional regulator [Rhodococcus sp. (in: high G+C Gram-positive bacteria)]